MIEYIKTNKRIILYHITAWIALIVFILSMRYIALGFKYTVKALSITNAINFIVMQIEFYAYYIFVMNISLKRRSFWVFFFTSWATLFLIIGFKIGLSHLLKPIFEEFIISPAYRPEVTISNNIFTNILLGGFFAFCGVVVRFIVEWFRNEKLKETLKQENIKSELMLLRQQVNPHFLFNTLNNIYSLVYKKADIAPDSVLKLSSIMRYMLYDSNSDFVDCKDEIAYLTNYIELEKLRLVNKENIIFQVDGDCSNCKIAPMLFIPFIENAFKHGNQKNEISIKITFADNKIKLHCSNIISDKTASKDSCGGIGLTNVKRRLNLIYPNKHKLEIKELNNIFTVNLTLNL